MARPLGKILIGAVLFYLFIVSLRYIPRGVFDGVDAVWPSVWAVIRGPVIAAWTVFTAPGLLLVTAGLWLINFLGSLVGLGPWGFPAEPTLFWGAVSLAAILFSVAFWVTVTVRFLAWLGRFDPFRAAQWQKRRDFLEWLVRLREGREIRTRFGRGPTSAFAGWIETLSRRWLPGDIFMGRPNRMLRPVGFPTEKHMVTIAGTGSGKSTAALVPNLCLHEGSLLCVDPKGELATVTANRRGHGGNGVEGMGQDVYVLDPFSIVPLDGESAAYNVFDEMASVAESDPDAPVAYAGRIADALVKKRTEGDPYWDSSAHSFIRGLILYVFVEEPPEKRNLVRLRQLVVEGDVEGYEAEIADGTISRDDGMTAHEVLFQKMRMARDGPYGDVIAGTAGTLLTMSPNQRGSVMTTAAEHTSFLDAPEIQRLSLRSDFLLHEFKTKRMSVYLCLPFSMVSGKEGRWLRMFVMLFIDMMERKRQPPNPPVLLAIDEFPSLGKIDGIEVVAPVMRSYGVRFWVIAQDIQQLEKVYPGIWGGFVGNAEAVQFMGLKEMRTAEFLVKLLGRHNVAELEGSGQARRLVKREYPLLDAEQVARLLNPERHNQIVWRGARRHLLLKTTPYFEYLPWWYYDPDPRYREKWNRRLWRRMAA